MKKLLCIIAFVSLNSCASFYNTWNSWNSRKFWTDATYEDVEYKINSGLDINSKNKDGETPLILATKYSLNSEIIELLIRKGAKVNYNDENCPLYYAVANDNFEFVKILIKNGADINKYCSGDTVLIAAYTQEMLKFLLKKGINIDKRNLDTCFTALIQSSNSSDLGKLKLLIKNGANVNARSCIDNKTALMFANDEDIIKYLVINSADIYMKDSNNFNALWSASKEQNSAKIFNILISAKKLNKCDIYLKTILLNRLNKNNSYWNAIDSWKQNGCFSYFYDVGQTQEFLFKALGTPVNVINIDKNTKIARYSSITERYVSPIYYSNSNTDYWGNIHTTTNTIGGYSIKNCSSTSFVLDRGVIVDVMSKTTCE